MRVQSMTITDVSLPEVTVKIQLSDLPDIEESRHYVIASVKLANPSQHCGLGELQLDVLKEVQRLVAEAAGEIEEQLRQQA
ncbi:MAG TPA: hypothetical protein VFV10_04180 [Gammaproteobacteria bacterium]|nr:hypothetical protein [Gammaproteobacteria bacterium]